MVDNLDNIVPLLNFTDPDKFYFIEVMQRKKDLPDLDKSVRLIHTYTVSSGEKLRKIYPEIVRMCDTFNARAYMYINRRSYRDVGRSMIKTLADYIYSDQYDGISHLFTSECGKHPSGDKIWILDVDGLNKNKMDIKEMSPMTEKVADIMKNIQPVGDKLLGVIPSKHGYHILVKPFDLRNLTVLFNDICEYGYKHGFGCDITIELKKDDMINLYIP